VSTENKTSFFHRRALALAEEAQAAGVIITINREPLQPLAMGNHKPVVTVYETKHVYPKEQS
jgi:hypothetical protein